MSWSIVCTTNAPVKDIAHFVAHHLSLGCQTIHLFLDTPVEGIELLTHPQLHISSGDSRSTALHHRQMANAACAYKQAKTDWLAHFDIDEFLIASKPLGKELASLPSSAEWVSLYPVEPLIPAQSEITLYKRAPRHLGKPRAILEEIYHDYGLMLRSGFLGYDTGKPIARTGLPHARLGVHKLLGAEKPARISACLAHHHAPSWESFIRALPARLANGSYAAKYPNMPSLAEVISLLQSEGGDDALRAFYMALRKGTEDHKEALQKHGLLLHHPLRLDLKAKAMFPEVFEGRLI